MSKEEGDKIFEIREGLGQLLTLGAPSFDTVFMHTSDGRRVVFYMKRRKMIERLLRKKTKKR